MASVNSAAAAAAADGGADHVSPTASSGPGPTTNPKMRKRTKTGCLTCRKRRIKCGEERPTCANCIKSKRQCEGYNQRVIFKPPIGDWPNHPGVVSTLPYHSSMLPGSRPASYRPSQSAAQPQESTLTSIQPRPLTQFEYADSGSTLAHLNTQQAFVGSNQSYARDANFQQPLPSPHHPLSTPTSASYFPQPSPVHASFQGQFGQEGNAAYEEQQRFAQNQYQHIPAAYDHVDRKPSVSQASPDQAFFQQHHSTSRPEESSSFVPQSSISPQSDEFPTQLPEHRPSLHRYSSHSQVPLQHPQATSTSLSQVGLYPLSFAVSHANSSHSNFQPVQIPQHDVTSNVKYMPQHSVYEQPDTVVHAPEYQSHIPLSGFGGEDHVSPTQVLDEAAVEEVDDDYWDVCSDEDMLDGVDENDEDTMILSRDFSLIRRIHFENTNELAVRRYDAFIYEGILSNYKAEQVANPLKNPKTARVFAHFIHVTAPSLSIYERNPRNPASIFEGPTPHSQQSLWTYILPLKALNHQGLLHSMLALASLHIAKLQRASVTPSYKHYAYALKRLGRSLGNPKTRLTIATFATSLMLGWYEIMTAEHVKWSTHLVGAAQLVSELDFPALTQKARRLRDAHTPLKARFFDQQSDILIDHRPFDQKPRESVVMPDENLVSTIAGKQVSYDDYGRVFEDVDMRQEARSGFQGKLDVRAFETLQDLYWYYARQDAFQSMVSGNRLVTNYSKWTDCPPRAPLGRKDALYGTHDHIILLIGRITDFIVRDRERKIKQIEADGGQWRPRPGMPGMPMGPPPSSGPGGRPPPPTTPMGPPPHMKSTGGPSFGPPPEQRQAQSQGPPRGPPGGPSPSGSGPGFFGMAPTRPPIPLPNSYAHPDYRTREEPPKTPITPHPKFADLPAAYEAALTDWNSISHAHATIARVLANTDAFAPLTPDLYPVAPGGNMTPFGPALVHRSYDISTLWNLLHLANILLLRSHPAMPPAAMIAAGVCAQATQPYTTLIGRIAAGMQVPASDDMPLSPFLGAALIESTMPLFFAGIQYQGPDQRAWLIKRLLDIDRRTGWASAAVIARSCETAWEKAAELGRGPPYERRRTRRIGEEGPIAIDGDGRGSGWGGGGVMRGQRGSVAGSTMTELGAGDNGERGFIVGRVAGAEIPWARNLLTTDDDLRAELERVELGGQ